MAPAPREVWLNKLTNENQMQPYLTNGRGLALHAAPLSLSLWFTCRSVFLVPFALSAPLPFPLPILKSSAWLLVKEKTGSHEM